MSEGPENLDDVVAEASALAGEVRRLRSENERLREALVVLYGWTPEGVQGFIDAASLSETGGEG